MPTIRSLLRLFRDSPDRLFWAFALTHLVLWTLVSSLLTLNLPLDVIEGYAWGREWLLGTAKHPPMQAWILEGLYGLTGRARWAPYLASQLAVVTAFWAVWDTGRRITGARGALIGTLLLEGVVYYNFTSPEFNPNLLQLPFWALAGWSFHRAVTDDRYRDWVLLGLWAACGLYSKYSTGLFLAVLAAALVAHRDGRARLARPGPYLAVAVATLLFAPHLYWLAGNHFFPFHYALHQIDEGHPKHYSALMTTCMMVLGQIGALLPALILTLLLYNRRKADCPGRAASFDRVFLSFAAFGPFLAMLILSLACGTHIRDMWETPFWNFAGLWAVAFIRPSMTPHDLRRFGIGWSLVFLSWIGLFAANEVLSPYVTERPRRTIFPGKHLAHAVENAWTVRFHTPLRYIVGNAWPAGNVAWYASSRPHVFIDGDNAASPWIDRDDLTRAGGVIVWCITCKRTNETAPTPAYVAEFPGAAIQPPLTLPRMTKADVAPAVIGWAIVPPRP